MESGAGSIAASRPLPSACTGPALPYPGEHLGLHPFMEQVRQVKKKKMAQMKEQIKAPEKTQLSNEEIAHLSDAQFKHW